MKYLVTQSQKIPENYDITIDAIVARLDIESLQSGDVVIGSLPIEQIAKVIYKGARYVNHASNGLTEYAVKAMPYTEEANNPVEELDDDYLPF